MKKACMHRKFCVACMCTGIHPPMKATVSALHHHFDSPDMAMGYLSANRSFRPPHLMKFSSSTSGEYLRITFFFKILSAACAACSLGHPLIKAATIARGPLLWVHLLAYDW